MYLTVYYRNFKLARVLAKNSAEHQGAYQETSKKSDADKKKYRVIRCDLGIHTILDVLKISLCVNEK